MSQSKAGRGRTPRILSIFLLVSVWLSAGHAVAQSPGVESSAADAQSAGLAKRIVVVPKLVHFAEAKYPEEASRLGVRATVKLKVLVNADGSVGDISVLESAGSGFDEAATEALRRFVFTPAQVDGVAKAVYIPFDYEFNADAMPADAAPQPAEEQAPSSPDPTGGNLEGRLLVAGVDAPLAGAVVSAENATGSIFEATSDAEGKWALVGLEPGRYAVSVQVEGFDTVQASEEVILGEATTVLYRVAPKGDGTEIIILGDRPPREVTRRTLERREIARIPGTGGDAIRSIQSLPGVARPPGLAGLLIVRGSGPQDTNVFVDGTLVPLIYHFGGLSSVIPTELLDKIDFYPGNFSAKYGRVMGGVVDVKLRSPDTECTGDYGVEKETDGCFHGMAQADLIDTRLLVRGPLGDDWTFAIAGRRSWVDVWLKPVLEEAGAGVTAAPVYQDYQIIAETAPTPSSSLRLQFYGTDDELEILIANPSAQEPSFSGTLSFGTAFYRAQAVYENQLTKRWSLASTFSVGRNLVNFSIGPALFRLASYSIVQRSEMGWALMKSVKANLGFDFLANPYHVRVRSPEPPRPGEPSAGPFSSRPILETDNKGIFFRPAWYGDLELQPTQRLFVVPAVRLDFARDTGEVDISPRVTARYTIRGIDADADAEGRKPFKTVLKGGAGLFFQPPQPQEVDLIFGSPGLGSNRSAHYIIGVEQGLGEHLELSIEGYIKELDQLVSRAPAASGANAYNNLGTGRVIGAETLLKYNAGKRFFGWLAYTLSKSTRKNGPDQDEYRFQFDQTHILTMLGSYQVGNGWEFGARFRVVSGNMYTAVPTMNQVPGVFAADAGSYVPQQGKPFGDRLPLFNQIDIRIEKTWQFRDWQLRGYLDVWNAYNNAAVEGVTYNYNYSKQSFQTGLPIIPSLGVRGEF